MVPFQLELEGFLCYKDRQFFDFSGASLWMLCGANGAGKSAVFDAIRFALFGQTRTGTQGTDALIHFQKLGARVVLTAEIGGEIVRLTRTVSSKRATWQIERCENGTWSPIPQTDSRDGYRNWVESHLGFSDETFRATMYLGQGKADRLLDANTAERTEILAQIVDLKPYQHLHELAADRARSARNERERAAQEWEKWPEIALETIETARANSEKSCADLVANRAQIAQIERDLPWCAPWEKLSESQSTVQAELESLRAILENGAQIEADFSRLEWLENALPVLKHGTELQSEITRLQLQMEALSDDVKSAQSALQLARSDESSARERAQFTREAAEQLRVRQTWALSRANDLAPQVALFAGVESLTAATREIEKRLAELPRDLGEKWETAQRELGAAHAAKTRLPHAETLVGSHAQFVAVSDKLGAIEARITALENAEAELKTAILLAQNDATQSEKNSILAQNEEAKTRARWEEAKAALNRFESLADAAQCAFCGHELTHEHRQNERARLNGDLENARQSSKRASEKWEISRREKAESAANLARALEAKNENQRAILEAENEARLNQQTLNSAREKIGMALRSLEIELDEVELKAEFLEKIFARIFPQGGRPPQILEVWRQLSKKLPALEDNFAALESQRQNELEWRREHERLARELADLHAQIGNGSNEILHENEALKTQIAELKQEIPRAEGARKEVEIQLVAAERSRETCEKALGDLERIRAQTSAPLEARRGAFVQLLSDVSAEIRAILERDDLSIQNLEFEKLRLESSAIREQKSQLDAATARQATLENELKSLALQLEHIPHFSRVPRALLEKQLEKLRLSESEIARQEKLLARELEALEVGARARENARVALAETEREEREWTTLRDLLGREGLQKFLLVEAENGIIEAANEVLERLSSGTLYLHLADSQTQFGGINRQTGALNFVVSQEDTSGQRQTILSPYLSGSQRFRVAVALAIGLGRYAAKKATGARMECVIIDEGFGSLDKLGREEMRDELHNLGRELRRVMVVSHQDDFAQSFPNRFLIVRDGLESRAVLQSQ